ncbi:glyoxalase [Paraoerskovia sediminicola]|uniref:Glyoxalase n=1 Tax=Paraoerskovia sediminicola TaxID=1138587 RepID=A0ABN6X871_9CELL|nr:VOC family protein [Paraoerskovia sediminicola]BDZ40990.1 glyoxalase [Paraoerskovia sediminicola]
MDLLDARTAMDAVTLHVRDLDATTAYYRDGVGLEEIDPAAATDRDLLGGVAEGACARGTETVVLGRAGVPVVVLRRESDLPTAPAGQAGLFHTAIVFESPSALAAAVASLARWAPQTFVGSADHLVSEAFYFTDPEGNGVELYTDRPRGSWTWTGGRVHMDTVRLDPMRYLDEHLEPAGPGSPATSGRNGAEVGHVHLQVGDVGVARDFYVGLLGFEETAQVPGALFVAAGGYHHHMAMNSWNSRGAGPRAAALGLGQVSIRVPTADDVAALAERLDRGGVAARHDGATLRFEDPWRTLVEVGSAG